MRCGDGLLYPGPTTTVRELAIQSHYKPLYSIVLDIPHVPLPNAVPQAARAIFPLRDREHAEYTARFLQYPTDIVDVFQWAVTTAAEHHNIPWECRLADVSIFTRHLNNEVLTATKWICANRENGMEEMREAGHRLEEWHRRRAAANVQIPELLKQCIIDFCGWANSL
jgi:hypothetical protein